MTSLYPSLMLQYRHAPAADRLGVFLKLLGDLRSFRVQAKALARELAGTERRNADALQLTFKILINSFYGYLGFSLGHFNDFGEANALTKRGRDLIQRAVAELEERGAQVIEVDTDGIYFVPPRRCGRRKGRRTAPGAGRLDHARRHPARNRRPLRRDVLLQNEKLCAAG